MKDIFWKYFTETGNIELYLEYKKHCRDRQCTEEKTHGADNEDKGPDSQDSQQRRQ